MDVLPPVRICEGMECARVKSVTMYSYVYLGVLVYSENIRRGLMGLHANLKVQRKAYRDGACVDQADRVAFQELLSPIVSEE